LENKTDLYPKSNVVLRQLSVVINYVNQDEL